MVKEFKYKVKDHSVFAGKTEIARSCLGSDGYEVRVLQGTPRMEVIEKIFRDCPEFAEATSLDRNKVPRLFSK